MHNHVLYMKHDPVAKVQSYPLCNQSHGTTLFRLLHTTAAGHRCAAQPPLPCPHTPRSCQVPAEVFPGLPFACVCSFACNLYVV